MGGSAGDAASSLVFHRIASLVRGTEGARETEREREPYPLTLAPLLTLFIACLHSSFVRPSLYSSPLSLSHSPEILYSIYLQLKEGRIGFQVGAQPSLSADASINKSKIRRSFCTRHLFFLARIDRNAANNCAG